MLDSSRCSDHRTGIKESSRSLQVCLQSVELTSGVVLRLTYGRLHCYVSAACPPFATSSSFKTGMISKRESIFLNYETESVQASTDALATVSSSNYVGRMNLTSIAPLEFWTLISPRRRL